jgi:Pyruvate/2-oxoacid:ferredoxin oxidoreductase gamma subunit
VRPGGWILYNGDALPADCLRGDVHELSVPFTQVADEIGDARITNMVMLGALLEITGALPQASVDSALRRLVKSARWYELDERALERGRELYRGSLVAI